MKKRFYPFIIITAFALLFGNIPVFGAPAEISYRASADRLSQGDTFTVTVSFEDAADVKSMKIDASYDEDILELVSGEWLLSNTIITYADSMPALAAFSKNKTVEGDVFVCTFKVKEDAPSTVTDLSLDIVVKTKPDGTEVILDTSAPKSISVTVGNPTSTILGDINADGTVDTKDLTRLMKLIAGGEALGDGADITGDRLVNAKDLTRLMKIIAGDY